MVKGFLTWLPRRFKGERTVPSVDAAGKTEYHKQKCEFEPLPYTIYKNQLKMDYRRRSRT